MITIIGAGMAGLIAANILRKQNVTVLEAQPKLPHNHKALLRFRNTSVSDATGVPFKKVTAYKGVSWGGVVYNESTIPMQNAYALKVSGQVNPRSIVDLSPAPRYIAPPDFIEQLADGIDIRFDKRVRPKDLVFSDSRCDPIISTMPMGVLMDLLKWHKEKPDFQLNKVYTLIAELPDVDAYQTIYHADAHDDTYRSSIVGSRFILEFTKGAALSFEPTAPDYDKEALIATAKRILWDHYSLGTDQTADLTFKAGSQLGKLVPIGEGVRKEFIRWATEEHNVYSLGRFGCFRQILLDDVVGDVMRINAMMKDPYQRKIAGAENE